MRGRYYHYQYYPHPAGRGGYYNNYYYDGGNSRHRILDKNNNIYERNPYPFDDGAYWDSRLMGMEMDGRFRFRQQQQQHPYYYDSRYRFHGRSVDDPYTSYTNTSAYYHTPPLSFPQPPPPPSTHPFYFPESTCSLM